MKKYLIVQVTNGEGYSDPQIDIFSSEDLAVEFYNKALEELVKYNDIRIKSTVNNEEYRNVLLKDSKDDYGIHFYELDYHTWYSIAINCNYSDEIKVIPTTQKNLNLLAETYNFPNYTKNSISFNFYDDLSSCHMDYTII